MLVSTFNFQIIERLEIDILLYIRILLKDMNRYLLLFGITILGAASLLVDSLDAPQDISGQQASNMTVAGNRTGMIANETQPFNLQESVKGSGRES
jgi:hypothetical protein